MGGVTMERIIYRAGDFGRIVMNTDLRDATTAARILRKVRRQFGRHACLSAEGAGRVQVLTPASGGGQNIEGYLRATAFGL
jgi:hypothetical protein